MYFNIPLNVAVLMIVAGLITDAVLEPFIAIIADKTDCLKVIKTGIFILIILIMPVFYLLSSGNLLYITSGLILLSCIIAIICAPLNAYMVSLFPKEFRYSGFGVAFNIGTSLFGGTAPLVMLWLIGITGNVMAPAGYYIAGAIVGLFSLFLCEMSKKEVIYFESITIG